MADMPYWYTGPKQPFYEASGPNSFIGGGPSVTQADPDTSNNSIVSKVLKFLSAQPRFAANSGSVIGNALAEGGQGALDAAVGVESPNPFAGTRAAWDDLRRAGGDFLAPAKAGMEAVSGAAEDYRQRRMAEGAMPRAGTEEDMQPVPTARRRLPAAPGAFAAAPTAAPAAQARRPGATMPPAAFADGQAMPPAIRPAPEDMPQGAFDAAPAEQSPGALAVPTAPRPSLADEYRKRVAAVKAEKGDLTEADKHKLQMDFFLGLLANNQPGSRFLQNVGKSGQAVSAEYSKMSKEAKAAADRKYGKEVDQIFREMGFADKDADNARADRKELAEEKRWDRQDIRETARWDALNAREKQRLDLELKRFDREGTKPIGHQVLGNGNIGFLMPDGKTVNDSGVKAKAPASDADPLERGVASLRRLFPQETNEQLFARLLNTKRDTTTKDKNDADQISDIAGKIISGDVSGKITPQEALKNATEIVLGGKKAATGGGAAADALPAGLPPGSKLDGTKNGKRVFKLPDGSRVTEK